MYIVCLSALHLLFTRMGQLPFRRSVLYNLFMYLFIYLFMYLLLCLLLLLFHHFLSCAHPLSDRLEDVLCILSAALSLGLFQGINCSGEAGREGDGRRGRMRMGNWDKGGRGEEGEWGRGGGGVQREHEETH